MTRFILCFSNVTQNHGDSRTSISMFVPFVEFHGISFKPLPFYTFTDKTRDHPGPSIRDSPWWSVTNRDKPCTNRASTGRRPGPSGSERKKLNMFDFSPGSSRTKINRVGSVNKPGRTV
jgi:hypothetical protein